MILSIILLTIGLAILVFGADYLVKGAASLSKRMKIPSLVIGLTVVAFGTSAPELIVNIMSAINGTADIALGNIIGSNITNILLILGLATLFTSLSVQKSTAWKEVPFAFLGVLVVLFMTQDVLFNGATENILTRSEGFVIIGFFAVFMYYIFEIATKKNRQDSPEEQEDIEMFGMNKSILYTIGGLVGLFLGGKLLVDNAVILAQMLGMSEFLIGLTIVAIGTSLPELATTIIAARRGQADLAVGNIVGSNIFNIFWILGLTAVITPVPVSGQALFDILACGFATLLLFVFMFIGKKHELEKSQGIIFLLVYLAYMIFIIMRG